MGLVVVVVVVLVVTTAGTGDQEEGEDLALTTVFMLVIRRQSQCAVLAIISIMEVYLVEVVAPEAKPPAVVVEA